MEQKTWPFHFFAIAGLFAIQIFCVYHFDGTGDSGDSIQHYLFAHYAPKHPALFFDHWAKPLYVLVASFFAQFGFTGIKWMNTILFALTAILTTSVAKQLQLKQYRWAFLVQYFAPFCFAMTFSGLTEYLFAFLLALSLFFQFRKQFVWAALIVSFLPFVRSEGLLFIGVFMAYYVWQRNWKSASILLTGHFVYSILGFFVYHDLLWVFEKNPYAKLHSTYGHGAFFHFAGELYYVLGLPLYLIFLAGLIQSIRGFFVQPFDQKWLIFVPGAFLVFFLAHSLFWYFGIFNSMGLKRVFIAVIPLMSLMMLTALESVSSIRSKSIRTFLITGIVSFVVIFPFLDNPAALHPQKELVLRPDQVAADQIKEKLGVFSGKVFYNQPYISMALSLDPFDDEKVGELRTPNDGKSGDILIWDSWFSYTEAGLKENTMKNSKSLELLFEMTSSDNLSKFCIYRRR